MGKQYEVIFFELKIVCLQIIKENVTSTPVIFKSGYIKLCVI
jgi:hypothetical protein